MLGTFWPTEQLAVLLLTQLKRVKKFVFILGKHQSHILPVLTVPSRYCSNYCNRSSFFDLAESITLNLLLRIGVWLLWPFLLHPILSESRRQSHPWTYGLRFKVLAKIHLFARSRCQCGTRRGWRGIWLYYKHPCRWRIVENYRVLRYNLSSIFWLASSHFISSSPPETGQFWWRGRLQAATNQGCELESQLFLRRCFKVLPSFPAKSHPTQSLFAYMPRSLTKISGGFHQNQCKPQVVA